MVPAIAVRNARNILKSTLHASCFVRLRGRAVITASTERSVGQLLVMPASIMSLVQTSWQSTYLISGLLVLIIRVSIALFILFYYPEDLSLAPAVTLDLYLTGD